MYFVSIFENRRMKPVEMVLRGKIQLRYCKYMCKCVQLLYANKILKIKKSKKRAGNVA
jgi:hypothetical protein